MSSVRRMALSGRVRTAGLHYLCPTQRWPPRVPRAPYRGHCKTPWDVKQYFASPHTYIDQASIPPPDLTILWLVIRLEEGE
jgi:hypothetical protein